MIAPMVAARNPDVAFIVLMAGPGVRGDEILPAQVQALDEAAGMSPAMAAKAAEKERQVLAAIEKGKDSADVEKQLREIMGGDDALGPQMKMLNSPWFRYFLEYDPAAALRKVKCPVLALNGEKDRQVPPKQNLPAIRKALQEGGNQHFETVELPGLNHLFQTAKTGGVSEYAQIEETISPVALEKIASWILKTVAPN